MELRKADSQAVEPMDAARGCVQIKSNKTGELLLSCRIDQKALLKAVGAAPGSDPLLIARIVSAGVSTHGGCIVLQINHDRPKLGPSIVARACESASAWVIGPLPLDPSGLSKSELIMQFQRFGLLPLAWSDIQIQVSKGVLKLPDLSSISAEICTGKDNMLTVIEPVKLKRHSKLMPAAPPEEEMPMLPFDAGITLAVKETQSANQSCKPTDAEEARMPVTRKRTPVIRLSVSGEGRLGLTVPPSYLTVLADPETSSKVVCCLDVSGSDLIMMSEADPAASQPGALHIPMRYTGPNWYGRIPLKDQGGRLAECLLGFTGAQFREGKEFQVQMQCGRILLEGAFEADAIVKGADRPGPVATSRLSEARRLLDAALTIIAEERSNSRGSQPRIEFLDDAGEAVVNLPSTASASRITIEVL